MRTSNGPAWSKPVWFHWVIKYSVSQTKLLNGDVGDNNSITWKLWYEYKFTLIVSPSKCYSASFRCIHSLTTHAHIAEGSDLLPKVWASCFSWHVSMRLKMDHVNLETVL